MTIEKQLWFERILSIQVTVMFKSQLEPIIESKHVGGKKAFGRRFAELTGRLISSATQAKIKVLMLEGPSLHKLLPSCAHTLRMTLRHRKCFYWFDPPYGVNKVPIVFCAGSGKAKKANKNIHQRTLSSFTTTLL